MPSPPLRTNRVIDVAVLLLLVLILVATLVPWTASSFVTPRFRFGVSFNFLASDFVANVLLFGVLGFALTLRGTRFAVILLFAVLLSFSIETAQMSIPSRVTSFWDWVGNSTGAAVGASFLTRFPYAFSPSDRQAERLGLAFALLWCVALVASGVLLEPAPVVAESAYLQAPPRYTNVTRWNGKFDRIEINGTQYQRGKANDPHTLLRSLEGDFTLSLSGVAPADSNERRPLFAVSAHQPTSSVPIAIWTDGEDLLVAFNSLGKALTFYETRRRAEGMGAQLMPHRPFRMTVSRREGETCMAIGHVRTCEIDPSIDEAWRVWLVEMDRWRASAFVAGLLWMAALAVPAGYFFRASARGFLAAGITLSSFLLIPTLTPLRAMQFESWLLYCTIFVLAAWSAKRRDRPSGVKSHDVHSDS